MKTYKTVKRKVEDKVICDVCGKTCTNDFYEKEYATVEASWGYGSKQDGSKFDIQLCENCFMIAVSFLRNQRSKHIPTPKNDPLNGKDWL